MYNLYIRKRFWGIDWCGLRLERDNSKDVVVLDWVRGNEGFYKSSGNRRWGSGMVWIMGLWWSYYLGERIKEVKLV